MADGSALPLLLASLRGDPPPNERDWDRILALANETLTTGTLAQRLLDHAVSPRLPGELVQFLETILQRVEERNERMDRQLAEAVSALHRAGFQPLLIKGVALKALAPEQANGRILSDIDLVLPKSARKAAVEALGGLGYAPREVVDASDRPVVLSRPEDVGMIDLQFAFRAAGLGYDYEDLLPWCRAIPLGDGVALLPDATMQAALLVIHDQIKDQDYWRGLVDLRHLLDIEMLASDIDWHRLSVQFPGPFAQAALLTQLVALDRLLDLPIPAPLIRGAWPRLQHWRRMAQMRWPRASALFSYLTILADLLAGRVHWRGVRLIGKPPRIAPRTGGSEHLMRQKAVGKV